MADQLHVADYANSDPETELTYVSAYVVAAKLLTKLGSANWLKVLERTIG